MGGSPSDDFRAKALGPLPPAPGILENRLVGESHFKTIETSVRVGMPLTFSKNRPDMREIAFGRFFLENKVGQVLKSILTETCSMKRCFKNEWYGTFAPFSVFLKRMVWDLCSYRPSGPRPATQKEGHSDTQQYKELYLYNLTLSRRVPINTILLHPEFLFLKFMLHTCFLLCLVLVLVCCCVVI